MRSRDLISESASAILYHYTNPSDAAKILQTGVFQLSSTVGAGAEEKWSPKGMPYFLSCTRSKVGDYHRWVGDAGVIFVLDGNVLNQHFKTTPVDYWERMWNSPGTDRTREAEDRVFSREPTMSINAITAVHAFIRTHHEWKSPATRQLLIAAKTKGIPTYLYDDEKAWRLQDIRRTIRPSQAAELLKGQVASHKTYLPHDYIEPWLELIHHTDQSALSPAAEKLRYNIIYYSYSSDPKEDHGLANDLGNARKPSAGDRASAVKLIAYLQKHHLSPAKLSKAMFEKWKKIAAEQREKNLAPK